MDISCQRRQSGQEKPASCQTGEGYHERVWLPSRRYALTSPKYACWQSASDSSSVCDFEVKVNEGLRYSRRMQAALKALTTNESFIYAYSGISMSIQSCVCVCASGLMKQCHFDGFFHFFGVLYESMGKFTGILNKDLCVCVCMCVCLFARMQGSWLRPSRDICSKKKWLDTCSKGPCIH